VVSFIPWSL